MQVGGSASVAFVALNAPFEVCRELVEDWGSLLHRHIALRSESARCLLQENHELVVIHSIQRAARHLLWQLQDVYLNAVFSHSVITITAVASARWRSFLFAFTVGIIRGT